ncbi:sigma-70 family RNA polymerase sigma factor [Daejeonella sp.]|uniref:RNA polymerase sigma factor n=1 Tax=Daejeonella sp. TaxID=2805397 RepID=UPI0030BEDDF7
MISRNELKLLIGRCIKKELNAQELLYRNFYGFSMNICLRYSSNRSEARIIINDGFLKIFNNLHKFDPEKPFERWVSRIMSNTAIDHYRAELKHMNLVDISDVDEVFEHATIEHKLYYDELIKLVQQLPPSYRTVFNLYAVDGLTHEEIAQKLKISVGGSKSNLFKARKKLRELLELAYRQSEKIINTNEPEYQLLRVSK